ncbi:MAG: hypothetical protein HY774_07980 [Acidobacteria bacterium]|nr:hypothetical protein [Acidobacteriota bacterium]
MNTMWPKILTNLVGLVGAIVQIGWIVHQLVNCYPYKMMSSPSAGFYAWVACVGALVVPPIAGLAGWWLSKRDISVIPAIWWLLTPLGMLAVFAIAHWVGGVDMNNTGNFDHLTPAAVFSEFVQQALWLAVDGVGAGAVSGIGLWIVVRYVWVNPKVLDDKPNLR